MHHLLVTYLPELVAFIELAGIIIILIGVIRAIILYVKCLIQRRRCNAAITLGHALGLGLSFMTVGEVFKTVYAKDLNAVILLGLITVVRAGIAILTHWEVHQEEKANEGNCHDCY